MDSKLVSTAIIDKIHSKVAKWRSKRDSFVIKVEKYDQYEWGYIVYATDKLRDTKIICYLFTSYKSERYMDPKDAQLTLQDSMKKGTWQVDMWIIGKNIYAFDPPSIDLFVTLK